MDKAELKDILSSQFNENNWRRVLQQVFGANKLHGKPVPIPLPTNNKAESAIELGSINTADERVVGIYQVNVSPNVWLEKNRVGLRQLLRNVYKYDVDGALIVFVQNRQWRFSYVSQIRTEKGKLETEPKRFTYLFGEGESSRTAIDRFLKLKGKPYYLNDLFEAFSVEKLNREFFKTYKEHYEKFWRYLASNQEYRNLLEDKRHSDLEKQQKPLRDLSKKLLGRIVFLQFLQKKGWMGASVFTDDWTNGDKKFLQSLFSRIPDQQKFHSKYLRLLFFETLNTKRPEHAAPIELGVDIKIPYLNGGLFDKDISYEHKIDFPSEYFFNLLDFFEQYNFTIDENDPYESEVGIDPEMLGHIFENLLEENREKGAFYTPKEIVHYMCQESLIEYLKSGLPEQDHSFIEQFVRSNQLGVAFTNRGKAIKINELLRSVKICDPAIGSGAFPMGLLKEIFECRRLIYPYLKTNEPFSPTEVKKDIIQNNIYGVDVDPGAVDIARLRFWLALVVDELKPQALPNLDYKIMQGNSLLESYEEIDLSKAAEVDDPVVRLVNPQVNIFTGKVEDPQMQYAFSEESKRNIKTLINRYFNEEDKDEKLRIHKAIDNIVLEHIDKSLEGYEKELLVEIATFEKKLRDKIENLSESQRANFLSRAKEVKEIEKRKTTLGNKAMARQKLIEFETTYDRPYFLWHLFFMDVFRKGGFDIIIGNPPYVDIKSLEKHFVRLLFSLFKTCENRINLYSIFLEFCLTILGQKGVLTFIIPNSILVNSSYTKIRKLINGRVDKIIKLPDAIFEKAIVETIVIKLVNNKTNKEVLGKVYQNNIKTTLEDIDFNKFDIGEWSEDSEYRFNIFSKTSINRIIKELEAADKKLVDVADFSLGITPYDKYKGHSEEDIQNRVFHSRERKDDSYVPLISGSNIHAYIYEGKIEEYIKYGDWLGAPREERFFKAPRNIVRQIVSNNPPKIYCCYTDEALYFTQVGFGIISKDEDKFPNRVITAVLNSHLIGFYHFYRYLDTQKDLFQKILIANCKRFPYPNIDRYGRETLEELVNKIIQRRKEKMPSEVFEHQVEAVLCFYYKLSEDSVRETLEHFSHLSKTEKSLIHGYYRDLQKGKFKIRYDNKN